MIEFNATFIVAMISFIVFIFIMNIIFYRPILSIIKKREDYMNNNHNEAKELTDQVSVYRKEIDDAVSQEKISAAHSAARSIEKLRKNAQDRISTNRIAANKKISDGKTAILEEEKVISSKIDDEQLESLSETLYDGILKGKL